jgi:hypothetical protein
LINPSRRKVYNVTGSGSVISEAAVLRLAGGSARLTFLPSKRALPFFRVPNQSLANAS